MAYYGQNYYPYYQPQQQFQPQQPQFQQPQTPTLYGKIVDGVDIVRATDVPFGMTAVFPKADASCVYMKSWNVDGTTRIDEYKKIEVAKETFPDITQTLQDIQSAIFALNEKVDALSSPTQSRGTPMKKKVGGVDES